jgi:predicted cupin superfamily sugar epimerase
MLQRVNELIKKYELLTHPEGGYYKETYRSALIIDLQDDSFNGTRNASTSIYYLLSEDQFSAFHRIKSDEVWHFYEGSPLLIYVIHPDSTKEVIRLGGGNDGVVYQATVPAGSWFASRLESTDNYAFVGCTVAPGFDFRDFEMAQKQELLNTFPDAAEWINELCKD